MSVPLVAPTLQEQALAETSSSVPPKSSSSSLPKKKGSGRVARIIRSTSELKELEKKITALPGRMSGAGLTPEPQQINEFLQNFNYPVLGTIVNGHICFQLPCGVQKLTCNFDFHLGYLGNSPNSRVVLVILPKCDIPFSLNDQPLNYKGVEVDVTKYLKNGPNVLTFNTTDAFVELVASIEWRTNTPEEILQNVVAMPPYELQPEDTTISDIDPITNRTINTPGRSINCHHCQCFDLLSFIESGLQNCPICGRAVSFTDLRYDPSFLKNCGTTFFFDEFANDDPFNFY